MVLATVGVWYLGDPIYNGYDSYLRTFGDGCLTKAWWEVLLFTVALGLMVEPIHHKINGGLSVKESQIFESIRSSRIDSKEFQDQVDMLGQALAIGWALLMLIALVRTDFDVLGMFAPYLTYKHANPWDRARVGGGFDAFIALANYIQVMLTALIGVVFALAKRPSMLSLSGIIYFLAIPFFVFDRTRNTMLATLLPPFLAFVTLRLKGGMIIRVAVVVLGFLALESWLEFVMKVRTESVDVTSSFRLGKASEVSVQKTKHEGLNMFEELGYINYFTENGTYKPNWGARYFAEAVNPIPRVLWPGKPLIGIDYAIARGMAYGDQSGLQGGVACSVSTGMIGQGVVNFGRILGPIAAALLMAIWIALLARQDLLGKDLGHLLLYAIGLVLTFNMGRDITLLVIYPFLFGWILLTWLNKRKKAASSNNAQGEMQTQT
jgi:ABC-type multidrug transport system fused ATPase/permease subunit